MRHAKKRHKLNRPKDQQKALLRGLAEQLLIHGQIQTNMTRAKVLRSFVEKNITKAKQAIAATEPAGRLHKIRQVAANISPRIITQILSRAEQLNDREGGYVRLLRVNKERRGDQSTMAVVQLLDS